MADNKKYDIKDRTFEFATRIIKLFRSLSKRDIECQILGKQLLRSGTSIGAMCQEAQAAESHQDLIHKYSIALKEARETLYWLRLLVASEIITPKQTESLIAENDEIIRILLAIILKLKSKPKEKG